jgi:hypothetical protein
MLMKKALLIGLALGLAVTFAVPAMAIDWSANGLIAVVGVWQRNVGSTLPPGPPVGPAPPVIPFFFTRPINTPVPISNNPYPSHWGAEGVPSPFYTPDAWNDENAFVTMRGELGVTARASEDLYGRMLFIFQSDQWGERYTRSGEDVGAWIGTTWGTNSVNIENLFIDFRMPPKLPIWLRVGLQTFVVRPHIFYFGSGPGVTGRISIDPIKMTISPMWGKVYEGYNYESDDTDIYAVDANIPVGPVRIGGFLWWQNVNDPAGSAWALAPAVVDTSGNTDNADIWWAGFYADGKLGPVNMQFDFIYNGGSYKVDPTRLAIANWVTWGPTFDIDYDAWMVRGEASMAINKLMFGMGGLYATGEDYNTPDVERFSVPAFGSNKWAGPNQDSFLLTGGFLGLCPNFQPAAGFLGAPGSSLGGLWFVKAFARYQVTDWLAMGTSVLYIGDTADNGDTWGSALEATGFAEDNDEIGWEIDVAANVSLYKNLSFALGFGYLIAGTALEQTNGIDNENPHDPWAVQAILCYLF